MKESTDKKLTKLTKHLWIILGVALVILGLFTYFPSFFKAAYKNNIYDVREVERITGLRFDERSDEIAGVSCTGLYNTAKTDTDFAGLTYFLFPNVKSAEKALQKLAKGNHFYSDSVVVTDNTMEGYVYGVCDADIYEYYYRSGNLVIVTEAVYGCFGTVEELEEMAEDGKRQNERIEYLKGWLPTVFNGDK